MNKNTKTKLIGGLLSLAAAPCAFSQTSVQVYGVLDLFIGHQSTTVADKSTSLNVLGSNGELTSRLGFRGTEDLGGGYKTTFNIETGFDPSSGQQQNAFRIFDRQAWVGIGGGFGEVRLGRQNTSMFLYSGNMDAFGGATYGSAYNNFSNWLARVDNDISYISPKFYNSVVELHYSIGEKAGVTAGNAVYQAAVQSQQGPAYLALAYLTAANPTNTNRVAEIMVGGNYDYGHGKVYVGFFRANEVISATTGNAFTNPAGKYDPALGPVTNTAGTYHNTYSVSADYRVTPLASVGAGYGVIRDSSASVNNARQLGLIANYDLSKRTRLYSAISRLKNSGTAQFKMAGASITTGTFLTPGAGESETGFQVGIRHTF